MSSSAHCAQKLAKRLAKSWQGRSGLEAKEEDEEEEKKEKKEEKKEEDNKIGVAEKSFHYCHA